MLKRSYAKFQWVKKSHVIATYMSTGMFHEGYSVVLSTIQLLNLSIGQQCMFAANADEQQLAVL